MKETQSFIISSHSEQYGPLRRHQNTELMQFFGSRIKYSTFGSKTITISLF